MAIDIGTAKIAALFAESLLFGVHSMLYVQAMCILLVKMGSHTSGLSRPRMFLLTPCTLLFLMAALHLAVALREMMVAFVGRRDAPGGSDAYFADFHTAANVIQDFAFVASSIVADSVLTYRLYLVWNRNWVVIVLPILLVIVEAVTGFVGTCVLALPSRSEIGFSVITPWAQAAYASSLSMNVLATTLIVGRIWWASHQLRVYGNLVVSGASTWELAETIVQSGMISAVGFACLLGVFVSGSNAWYICFDILPPLIGINFTLIIVRLGLGHGTAAETLSSMVVERGREAEFTIARDRILDSRHKRTGLSGTTESRFSAGGGSFYLSTINDV